MISLKMLALPNVRPALPSMKHLSTIHNNAILRKYSGTNFWFTPYIMSRQQDRHHKNDQEQN